MLQTNSSSERLWGVGVEDSHSLLLSWKEIQNYLNCHSVVAKLLFHREFRSTQSLDRLFNTDLSNLPDPFSIIDMNKAVDRVIDSVMSDEQIAIYGDYDVDGTCGTALLVDFFRSFGVSVLAIQPNRFENGYGVHNVVLQKLIDQGAKLILSVDCGITAVDPAKYLKERGIDYIVVDHHKMGEVLPDAFAVVDPQRPEDQSGLTNLCGAGLAFFFAVALRSKLRSIGYFEGKTEPNLMRLLDLVAVSTVADVVDIRGVNRILVSHGLKVLSKNPRAGLKALLEVAAITQPNSQTCGFVLGPRINAAGRLQSADSALKLLLTTDYEDAKKLALDLDEINKARRITQDAVIEHAMVAAKAYLADERFVEMAKDIPAASFGAWPRAIVVVSPNPETPWHEGVVGIVASRLVEEFHRPVFILTQKHGDSSVIKGSIRSIPKIDILSHVSNENVRKHLLNFGGHAHAGGVTLKADDLWSFIEALNIEMALSVSAEAYHKEHRYDADIVLSEIEPRLVEELARLEPFGREFPEPVFRVRKAMLSNIRVMKEKHLKISVSGSKHDAVWFNAKKMESFHVGECADMWVAPGFNEWQGVKRLQLQIKHAQVSES